MLKVTYRTESSLAYQTLEINFDLKQVCIILFFTIFIIYFFFFFLFSVKQLHALINVK